MEIKIEGPLHKVIIVERERGWGSSTMDTKFFDSKVAALEFVREYNSKLPNGPAPDYYIQAEYCGQVA